MKPEILKATEEYLKAIIANPLKVQSVNIGFRDPLEGCFTPMSGKWEAKPHEGEVVIRFMIKK